jgi:hypothetical protein
MEGLLKFVGAIGLLFIIACLLALPLMWLWNWLMPELFDLQTIGFWQALGLNLLSSILFKSASSSSKD